MAFAFVAITGGTTGCAGRQVAASLEQVRGLAAQARDNGALRCAPRQLAMADTHAEFAARELDEGDYFRAREHLQVADDNAREALHLSPRGRCLMASTPSPRPSPSPIAADADGDGILDAADRCPAQAEDKDGFEDIDGCPDPDNDQDGVADGEDKCPLKAEDRDGFEDADGCPDPDNDQDGLADGEDKCPLEAGPVESGGCPQKYEHIQITAEKIELKQKIFFETNKAAIMSRSYGLLAEIANVLQNRPTMRLRIEGHTDTRGTPKRNMSLSGERANEVRAHLTGLGVAGDRLEARGYGSAQPIETNKTGAGRERNRRVEFVITHQ
ncbi:MAG: OmpA family protein [Polyangia bacterium]